MTQRSETILGFDRSNKISLFLQITRAFEKNFTLVLCSDSQLREFPMEKRNRHSFLPQSDKEKVVSFPCNDCEMSRALEDGRRESRLFSIAVPI